MVLQKKTGTEQYIPIIKDGGYINKDHYIKGFINTMIDSYGYTKEKAEEEIVAFIKVIEDASFYLFSLNHACPYSYEGYVSGYLRTHYPLQFLTVAFNINRDKEDKTLKLTEYANKNKINILNPRFRYSKSSYFFDIETNSIYKGIGSIKYLNDNIGNELYDLRENTYESFLNLLLDISEKTSINSRQLDILIRIGFFNEFGSIKKLLTITEIFNKWSGKKTISKSKIDELGLKEIDLSLFGSDKSEKTGKELSTYKDLRWFDLVLELSKNVSNKEFGVADLIRFQLEHLGYIYYTNKDMDKRYVVVTKLDTKYSPKFIGYCVNNGKTIELKIHNKSKRKNKDIKTYFQDCPLQDGDIIFMKTSKKENKKRNVDGEWQPIDGEYEWWIKDYIKVKL